MAKSKSGGTRSYIRGRIGSDVYSVGKDGKGNRQQVVRSLAEQVANPRTTAQMAGRMYMSTVMQAVSALSPIIDHSFDGIAKGQPSISEFIRRNYALVKADAVAYPASGNSFGLNKYQEKGIKVGAYVISNGSRALPSAAAYASKVLTVSLTADTLTVGGLKDALGMSDEGYITLVCVTEGKAEYVRASIDSSVADSTAITAENVSSLFSLEGNVTATIALSTNDITITPSFTTATVYATGVIVSDKVSGAWAHSACTLSVTGSPVYTSDVALPTYPTGSEMYLNGGDL